VREPLSTVCSTCTGSPIDARIASDRSRFSTASCANARPARARRAPRALGQLRGAVAQDLLGALEAEHVELLQEEVDRPALEQDVEVVGADLRDLAAQRLVGLGQRASIVDSTKRRLTGSSPL
jgi:hypothetical protein